jgi:hypothetical protein
MDDIVAAGPQGAVAWGIGRTAHVRLADGKQKSFDHPRSVEGIAFRPRACGSAWPATTAQRCIFRRRTASRPSSNGPGAHTGITFSPDGNFVVTTMQENALHGWKLADGKHMRMTGYPAKVKVLSWSPKGRWLASSGAPAAIVWPFQAKDGPMGKAPLELGTRGNIDGDSRRLPSEQGRDRCHRLSDGMVLAARFADQKEVLLRRPGKGPITSMERRRSG